MADFVPAPMPGPAIETAVPVGVATMNKQYEGEVAGRSATLFTAAFDQSTGTGTYVAMESFDGGLHGRSGAFNFAHSATTLGEGRQSEFFVIVPGSGTGELASPALEASPSTRTARTGSGSTTFSASSSAGRPAPERNLAGWPPIG